MFSYDNAADTFFRVTQEESWGVFAARHAQAVAGNSAGATRIDLAVNGEWQQSLPAAIDGAWSGEVWLQPGLWSSIEAQTFHLSGQKAAADTRHVKMSPENREDSRTTQYEPNEGWVTSRHSDTGTQTLHWDARDRLWKVHQRDALGNGYDWEAFYDGFGRRLRTVTTPVTQHSPDPAAATTIDSRYDPMVEFLEIALSIDSPHGQFRYWKVHGPDLNGHYGGRQGIGGLDAWVTQSDGTFSEILSDRFGHVLAYLDATNFPQWNNTPLAGYGPLPGYPTPHPGHPLDANNPPLHHAIHPHLWRGYRLDPTGLIHMGARYYDPQTGRFLSTDPLGHAASMDLYSYANGDPINWIDPTGRGADGVVETKWTWEMSEEEKIAHYTDISEEDARELVAMDVTLHLLGGTINAQHMTGAQAIAHANFWLSPESGINDLGFSSSLGNGLGAMPLLGWAFGPLGDMLTGVGNILSLDFSGGLHHVGSGLYELGRNQGYDAYDFVWGNTVGKYIGLKHGFEDLDRSDMTTVQKIRGLVLPILVPNYGPTAGAGVGAHVDKNGKVSYDVSLANRLINAPVVFGEMHDIWSEGRAQQQRPMGPAHHEAIPILWSGEHRAPGPIGQLYSIGATIFFGLMGHLDP